MAISTGNPVAWCITNGECEEAVWGEMVNRRGEISQDEANFLMDNVDFKAIAEEAADEFDDWFANGACYDDVISEIADLIREDAAYKKMIAERPSE